MLYSLLPVFGGIIQIENGAIALGHRSSVSVDKTSSKDTVNIIQLLLNNGCLFSLTWCGFD